MQASPVSNGGVFYFQEIVVKAILGWHLLPIVLLRHAIEEGRRFSWKTGDGEIVYDPRDFSYWGA